MNEILLQDSVLFGNWDILVFVVAHELGHAKDRRKLLAFAVVEGIVKSYNTLCLGLLIYTYPSLWTCIAAIVIMYLLPIFYFASKRIFERRANDFALSVLGHEKFCCVEQTCREIDPEIYSQNHSVNKWWELFYKPEWLDTHPRRSRFINDALNSKPKIG